MAKSIYRNRVSYLAVLNDDHNSEYMKLVEAVIAELGGNLKLSWGYGYDPDEFEDEEEMAEEIAEDPWYKRALVAEGEPGIFVIFFDDQYSVDLTGASEEWILLVNGILRELEEYNAHHFGEDNRMLDELNG